MDFPTLCRVLGIKPEDRTELDQVQRFITFCNEARRAPCFYPGLGRLYDEMAKPLTKAKQSGRRRSRIVVRLMRANPKRRRRPQPKKKVSRVGDSPLVLEARKRRNFHSRVRVWLFPLYQHSIASESVVRRRRRMMKLQNADANDAG